MTEVPEVVRLFTRGMFSIRLVREEHSTGCRLVIHGPTTETVTLDFEDVTACLRGQATVERAFRADGYRLAQSSRPVASQGGQGHRAETQEAPSAPSSQRSTQGTADAPGSRARPDGDADA